jgi:hypothetical protein
VRCCNHFSFFILTELAVGRIVGNVVAFLWRGAWGGFGGTNMRPFIIALVVFVCNRRDGRVATFRPIPQSVSGVGVRISIGDKIRNLGEKSFCLTRREGKFFILLRCCNHFSFFMILLGASSRIFDGDGDWVQNAWLHTNDSASTKIRLRETRVATR